LCGGLVEGAVECADVQRGPWHGVAGVDSEIDQDLLELPRIGQDRPRVQPRLWVQLDVFAKGAPQKDLVALSASDGLCPVKSD
jgi:hypothetical protein